MLLVEVFNKAAKFTMEEAAGIITATFGVGGYIYEVSLVEQWPKSKQGLEFFAKQLGDRPEQNDRQTGMEYTRRKNELQEKYPCYLLSFEIVKGLTDDQLEQQHIRAGGKDWEYHDDLEDGDPQFELSDTGNQFVVFSTIFQIMKKTIDIKAASGGMVLEIGFSGKGESRNSLYGKMINKFAGRIGFTSNTAGLSRYVTHYQKFLIINKEIA